MKKNILIGMIVMIMLIGFVNAADNWYSTHNYWRLDGNLSDIGTAGYAKDFGGSVPSYVPGILGQGIDYAGVASMGNLVLANMSNVSTIDYWVKFAPPGLDHNDPILSLYKDATHFVEFDIENLAIKARINGGGGAKNIISPHTNLVSTKWWHIILTNNDTGTYLYVNGTIQGNDDTAWLQQDWANFRLIYSAEAGVTDGDAIFDNIAFFNHSYDGTDALNSYNTGAGLNFIYTPPGTTINITGTPNPLDNESFNTQPINFNVSVNASYPFSCNLRLNSTKLVSHWSFDYDSNSTNTSDNIGSNDGIVINAVYNMTGGYDNFGSYDFDGIGDYIEIAPTNATSFSIWLYPISPLGTQAGVLGANDANYFFYQRNGNYWASSIGGGNFNIAPIDYNNWQNIIGTYDGTKWDYYKNGIWVKDRITTTSYHIIHIGRNGNAAYTYFNGSIDEVMIFNKSLSATEIANLYNQTRKNFSAGTDVYVDFSQTLDDGVAYSYSVECNDNTSSTSSADSIFYFDSSMPKVTTSFVDTSVYMFSNLTAQFNFSDNFILFSYNISIDNVEVAGEYNIGSNFSQYNLSYDINSLSKGTHTLTARVADGHTSFELLDDYSVSNGLFNDYIRYDTWDGTRIKTELKDSSWFDSWSSIQLIDRYIQIVEPANPEPTLTFVEESSKPIHIMYKEGSYNDWWVVTGSHWKDYVVKNEPNVEVSIKRITDYQVEVTISGLKNPEKIEFESLGDLNIIETNYTFSILEGTLTYVDPVIEIEEQEMRLRMYTNSNITNTNASLYYNSTLIVPAELIYATYTDYVATFNSPTLTAPEEVKQFYWNYTITNAAGTTLGSTNLTNQTVFKINIGNCSNITWAKALQFNLKDEITDAYVIGDLNIDLDVWYQSEALFRPFSFKFRTRNNYSICIYPNETQYKVNAVMEYTSPIHSDRKYYLKDYNLTNTTGYIDLYMLNNSLYTDVNIKVYDKTTGDALEGATIKILRYYPEGNESQSGGTYKTVEVERTDINGQTLAKMVLYDVFYKFIVSYGGVVRLNTDVSKILSTSKILPISISEDVLYSATRINQVEIEVTCDKATLICRTTWNDKNNLVQTVLFEVYRTNMFGKELIYSDETSSTAGSMVYKIVEDTAGNSYRAVAHIKTNTQYSLYSNLADAYLTFKATFEQWGGIASLFPAMLLIISVVFALMTTVGAIGVIIGSILSIIGLSLLGLLEMTFPNIMILIVLGGILIAKIKQ